MVDAEWLKHLASASLETGRLAAPDVESPMPAPATVHNHVFA